MKVFNKTGHRLSKALPFRVKSMIRGLVIGSGTVPRLEKEWWARPPRSALWMVIAGLSSSEVSGPGFILGCGRSGTTVFGEILGMHPEVAYLNEPRHIWIHEARADIWSSRAEKNDGKLTLGSEDMTVKVANRIDRAFRAQLAIRRRPRLIEKLPENTFRMGFVGGIYPDARFIHLIRNGYAVARSIGSLAVAGLWYGEEDYKWKLLEKLCRDWGELQALQLADDPFVRGLIEWKLSILSARNYAENSPRTEYMEIRFEDLIQDPVRTTCEALAFLGLDPHPSVDRAAQRLRPVSMPIPSSEQIGLVDAITGDLMATLGYGMEGPTS